MATSTHNAAKSYRDASCFGSFAAIYNAAGRRDPRAVAILAGMDADSKGDAGAFGFRSCMAAAVKGEPFASAVVDGVRIDFV